MKKIIALALSLALTLGLTACTPAAKPTPSVTPTTAPTAAYTAGSYEATVPGMKGDISVKVTVDETAITAVEVTANEETHGVGSLAIEQIPAAIVAGQTLAVDAIAGATITRGALLSAVSEALTQAGADLDALKKAPAAKPLESAAEETYDIVIVGAGGAGLSAAIEAGKAGGAKVLVLEKLAYPGGSTRACGGAIWTSNTPYNTEVNFTADELISFMESRSGTELNRPLLTKVAEVSGPTFNYLMENGGPFATDSMWKGHPDSQLGCLSSIVSTTEDYESGYGGAQIADFLKDLAVKNGAEIRLSSPVTSLIVEDGAVVGVHVQDATKEYDVRAQKVILATGGFTRNEKMIEELAPTYTKNNPYTGAGSTGDGITMTRDLDTVIVGEGMMCLKGLNMTLGYYGPIGSLSGCARILVNQEGKRFTNEARFYAEVGEDLNMQTDKLVYNIADSANGSVENLEKAVAMGLVTKADTLEALAAAIGVDEAAFVKTIGDYNAAQAAGENGEFGLPNEKMTPALAAPFYAVPVRPTFIGSIPGLKVDESTQVLTSAGSVIPNLYACGELTFGNLFSRWYPASGSGVGFAVYTGNIAGGAAMAALAK